MSERSGTVTIGTPQKHHPTPSQRTTSSAIFLVLLLTPPRPLAPNASLPRLGLHHGDVNHRRVDEALLAHALGHARDDLHPVLAHPLHALRIGSGARRQLFDV